MTLRERTNERSQEAVAVRPHVRGKFLYAGDEKLYVRGVTYSAFATDSDGNELFAADQVEHDFAAIAANGFNAVRVYTVPPRWLLDVAQQHQHYEGDSRDRNPESDVSRDLHRPSPGRLVNQRTRPSILV